MGALELILGIVLLVFAVITVIIVLSQQGEQKNSGVITGNSSDTYISRNSGRTIDAFLARWTRFFAVGFFIIVIAINVIVRFAVNPDYADAIEDNSATSSVSETVDGTESEKTSETESGSEESEASSEAESQAESTAA